MRVKNHKRLQQIRDYIQENGYGSVEQLTQIFNVSSATVRRDLFELEKTGSIKRTHGGAHSKTPKLITYSTRDSINHKQKVAIARRAVEFIKEGDTIYLDPGTTVEQLSLQIRDQLNGKALTIVSSSLISFIHLTECENFRLILLSGYYDRLTKSFNGPTTMRMVTDIIIDKYFMATIGVVPGYGLTDSSQNDCEIKKAVLERAREVILLVDSSKFNARGLFLTAPLSKIDYLITDADIPAADRKMLKAADCEPVLATVA